MAPALRTRRCVEWACWIRERGRFYLTVYARRIACSPMRTAARRLTSLRALQYFRERRGRHSTTNRTRVRLEVRSTRAETSRHVVAASEATSVIIPAFNEAAAIGAVVAGLK